MIKKQGWVGVDAPMDSSIVMGRVLTLEQRMLRLERRVEEAEKAIPALVLHTEVSVESDEFVKARETICEQASVIAELREKLEAAREVIASVYEAVKNG